MKFNIISYLLTKFLGMFKKHYGSGLREKYSLSQTQTFLFLFLCNPISEVFQPVNYVLLNNLSSKY